MPKRGKDQSVTHFMNVDLDLDVSKGMDELLKALEPALVIYQFGTRAGLELNLASKPLEFTIKGLVKLVLKLPPRARKIWDKAKKKTMNIGIQADMKPHSTEFKLSSEVLSLINSIGADVVFTVYGAANAEN